MSSKRSDKPRIGSTGKGSRLRQQAEAALRNKSEGHDDIAASSPEDLNSLLHELRVHQIELEMQNEELRRAQAELESARDRYIDLYDFAPVGYLSLRQPGVILAANLTASGMLGVVRSQLVGSTLAHFIYKEDQNAYYLFLITLFKPEARGILEVRLIRRDGNLFYARLEASVRDGEDIVQLIISDVTDLKRAEQALKEMNATLEQRVADRTAELRESQQRYSTIFDKSPFALALTRMPDGILVSVNNAFLDLFEQSREELLGRKSRELVIVEPDSRAQVAAQFQAHGSVQNFECTRTTKSGARRILSLSLDSVSIGGEKHILTTVRDITERRKAEEALRHAYDELELRVQDRTKELAALNRALSEDIAEREKVEQALEQRNLELQALSSAEHEQRQVVETMLASARVLSQTLELDTVLRLILMHVRNLVHADSASLILLGGESLLAGKVADGFNKSTDPNQIFVIRVDGENHPFYQKLNSTRSSLLIPDTAQELDWEVFPGTEEARTYMLVPIMVEKMIIGFIGLGKTEPKSFTEEHVKWAEALVGHAALAIQNAWLFQQVRAARERLQSLSRKLVETQEMERRYIARELHDNAGQILTSLSLGLGMLGKKAEQPEVVRSESAELLEMTNNLMEELHSLAINLRPTSLDHLGLVPSLRQLVRSIEHNATLRVRLKFENIGGADRLPENLETALYRIVQEALTNVILHAQATRADVLLERQDNHLMVLVEDDGVGFDVESIELSGHLGLLGVQERAEMFGGTLTLESTPGKGTTLIVKVPYNDVQN